MALTITEDVRAKAEIYVGDEFCQEKTRLLLRETGLPNGLLPLRNIIECGYVEETGFVWLRQRKKVEHCFNQIGRHVSYAAEISAYAEKGRLKKITGVKAKELLLWVNLHEICLDEPPTGKLICKAVGGFFRTFPAEAFEVEEKAPPPSAAAGDAGDAEKEEEKKKTEEVGVKAVEAAVQAEELAAKN